MQVTAFAHRLQARKRLSATSLSAIELTDLDDAISSILLLGSGDEVIALCRRIAAEYGYEVTERDNGPCCCEYGDFFDRQGILPPIHNCPAEAPEMLDSSGEVIVPKEWL